MILRQVTPFREPEVFVKSAGVVPERGKRGGVRVIYYNVTIKEEFTWRSSILKVNRMN